MTADVEGVEDAASLAVPEGRGRVDATGGVPGRRQERIPPSSDLSSLSPSNRVGLAVAAREHPARAELAAPGRVTTNFEVTGSKPGVLRAKRNAQDAGPSDRPGVSDVCGYAGRRMANHRRFRADRYG